MNFETFNEMTHEEIQNVLIEHLHNCRDKLSDNKAQLACDIRSMSLKTKGKILAAALAEIESLLDDLGIDSSEI